MAVSVVLLMSRCGFTLEQVGDLDLDQIEVLLKATGRIDLYARASYVVDTSAAIGGTFAKSKSALSDYLKSLAEE